MGWAIRYDPEILRGKPNDWYEISMRSPRAPNVNVGRNSYAMLRELSAGARTLQDMYSEAGEDWREQLQQKAKEAKYILQLANDYGVPVELISQIALPHTENTNQGGGK